LKRLLKEEHSDLNYQLQKIGDDLKIYPGDMEEFIEAMRWLLYCFSTLSTLEGATIARELAEQALNRLFPAELRENPTLDRS